MKYCEVYEDCMKQLGKTLPGIGYRRLKINMNKCKSYIQSETDVVSHLDCPACYGTFFPSLLDEMSAVVDCFDEEARKLLDPPISCLGSICKYSFNCLGNGVKDHNDFLIRESEDLLIYALVNAIAFRKILKKYDKVHKFEKGREFKSGAQAKNIEILQSPWFYELMSFQINLKDRKIKAGDRDASAFDGLVLAFNDDNPSMSCGLFGSVKIDVDLICPICLEIVFDAVALRCGHILCYMCACSAASVTIVDGLKAAAPTQKCPLCREANVYGDAIRLEKLNILLSERCPEYWEKRLESERVERLELVKEHWESQVHSLIVS